MKKKNLKSLKLNKKSISLITPFRVVGGGTHYNTGCLSCIDTDPNPPGTLWWSCNSLCLELCKPKKDLQAPN